MKIGNFNLDKGRALIIAEIGGNHGGDFKKAQLMIKEAARAGADAVKFQILKAEKIVSAKSKWGAYSGISHRDQLKRFRKIEFTYSQYKSLKRTADRHGVLFLASVFDPESVDEIDDLLSAYKVASGDLTYYSLLKRLKKKRKPILISTGASDLKEIREVLKVTGKRNTSILHCICAYPAPFGEMNLKAIPFLKKELGIPVGFSDHSLGIECCLAAVSLGACIIEKHFTLNKRIRSGDHRHSADPKDLKKLVDSIRKIEKALGSEKRVVWKAERRARKLVRRALYAASDLKPGKRIQPQDLRALRPEEGVPAKYELKVIGKKIRRPLLKGAPVLFSNLK